MTNNPIFNINHQNAKHTALTPKNRTTQPHLPESGIISAIIVQKDANGTVLQFPDDKMLEIRNGQGLVEGEAGDKVFFEISRADGNVALRQVFPEVSEQNFITHQYNIKNLHDLMIHKDFAAPVENPLDAANLAEERAELNRKADAAVAKLSRSISRIAGNTQAAAVAQLAASGVNIDKISIGLLDNVTSQLDAAVTANSQRVMDEISTKLDSINGLSDGQIARMLQNGTELTLDNIYIYKHSGDADMPANITEADWEELQTAVAKFFDAEGIDNNEDNLSRAKFLLQNGISLTADNFSRLIFLSDIAGNVDAENLLQPALELDYSGKGIGSVDIYENSQLKMAEARLKLSYEANVPLIGTDLEMDLTPQIQAMEELRKHEAEMTTALREVHIDNEAARGFMADVFKSLFTLPFIGFDVHAALSENKLQFTPKALENFITSQNYEANATVASLKHGDTFAKIAEQFAPLLAEMGLPTDQDSIKAAKILSANNTDINAENLHTIKDINAKIDAVQSRMHPRVAAQMIAEGLNPANMHIDDILQYLAAYEADHGLTDLEKIARHIVEMDDKNEIDEINRQKVIEIYQMLHKISKNGGAGVGFAINAGIELTLENLMDFSKNFDSSKGRKNTINYSVNDGTFYAKNLVTSFISAARPKPLASFVQNESLSDHLSTSVDKLENIAKNMEEAQIDTQRVNQAISDLSTSGRDNIRFLVSAGLPVTLANLRQLKAVKERNIDNDINTLDADELANITEALQGTDLAAYAEGKTAAELNENLGEHIETALEATVDTEKITKLDILKQNIDFRAMLLNNTANFSSAMRFNGRISDVSMYVINSEMNTSEGVTAYIGLKTAMGEVSGLLSIKGNTADVRFAANESAQEFLRQNTDFLAEMMAKSGLTDFEMSFVDNSSIKRQLSVLANLPI